MTILLGSYSWHVSYYGRSLGSLNLCLQGCILAVTVDPAVRRPVACGACGAPEEAPPGYTYAVRHAGPQGRTRARLVSLSVCAGGQWRVRAPAAHAARDRTAML